MMTFDHLHEGIENGCKCTNFAGVAENISDFFVRAVREEVLSIDDWKSYQELGKLPRYKQNCANSCKWRGVSIYKLTDNVSEIREKWLSIVGFFSPQGIKRDYVCVFRLKNGAGKVWDTSNNKPEAHHDLLKSDAFTLEKVEVQEIVPFSEF